MKCVCVPLRIFYQDLARALSAEKNILDTPIDSPCIPCIACRKSKLQHIFKAHINRYEPSFLIVIYVLAHIHIHTCVCVGIYYHSHFQVKDSSLPLFVQPNIPHFLHIRCGHFYPQLSKPPSQLTLPHPSHTMSNQVIPCLPICPLFPLYLVKCNLKLPQEILNQRLIPLLLFHSM